MTIVSSDSAVTLVGGAQFSRADLTTALSLAPTLVAADGGADAVLAAGQVPRAVIGDMDSLGDAARAAFAGRLVTVPEQETTDFDKALRHVRAPLVLALGVTGGRFDHELAMLHGLLLRPEQPCVALGAESVVCLCPPRLALDLAPGTVVSLFPMAPVRAGSTGLRWPTAGIDFAPGARIGTSNAATGPVTLTPDAPAMLLILPRTCLAVLVRALLALPPGGRWPARAG